MRLFAALSFLLLAVTLPIAQAGLDGESNTDGYNPGALGDEQGEARRQTIIARQIELVERMNWSAVYCQFYDPFEPWPAISGDIWGYPLNERVRQPIGHQSHQTGSNRWNYRPLYAEDVEGLPSPDAGQEGPAPEVIGPELPAPVDARPGDFVSPASKKSLRRIQRSPREF
jgi:hypothetical protein